MMRKFVILSTCLVTLSATAADTVQLDNGSQLMGDIVQIADGKLTLQTDFAGELVIDQARITAIQTDAPMNIALEDGSRMLGQVSASGGQVEVNAASGRLVGQVGEIQSAWAEGEPSPREAELESKIRQWHYEVSAGANGKTGNSESLGVDFAGKAVLEGPEDELSFYGDYRYAETDDNVSKDDAKGGVRYLNNFTGDWLWYIRGEIGRDAVKDLDLYTQAAGGLGYKLIERDNQNLTILTGIAHRSEVYGTGRTESFPAADVVLEHDYSWDWGKIYNNLTYTQGLSDMNQYTLSHESGIEFPIADQKNWRFRAGIENDYEGAPEPGTDRLDTTYFSRIVYAWE